ncbi:MAG: hypothetical protein P8Y25_01960 [Chromatiaceae bacterium]
MKTMLRAALTVAACCVPWPSMADTGTLPTDKPYSRDLVSISLEQAKAAGLDTGVYQGSDQVRADPDGYANRFHETLASKKRYLDSEHTRWEIVPVPEAPPPACDQPQPTGFDAEGCRYVRSLFQDLARQDPQRAHEYRQRVRRGREVWFKGTFGNQDLYNIYFVKILNAMPDYTAWLDTRNRGQRFARFGLINDPDCTPGSEATYWLDDCPDPHATGVLGVRKYYADPAQGFDPRSSPYEEGEIAAQKRYVIGFACAVCHVAFDPSNPPKDPANPRWENLMGGIGNQYVLQGRMFSQGLPEGSYLRVLIDAQRPGTSDTSLEANDYIHNPGTINAIMNTHNRPVFEERMRHPLTGVTSMARTRHVLKGGEDSVGEHLALLRVYVNIGLCSLECWTPNFPKIGTVVFDTEQKPFRIAQCAKDCEDWNYADAKMDDLLSYLLSVGPTYLDKAVDVDGTHGSAYINAALVPRGREVFIEQCARCHSSRKIPELVDTRDPASMRALFKGHIFGGFHAWRRELPPAFVASPELAAYLDPVSGDLKQQVEGKQDWLGNDQLTPYHEIGVNVCRSIQTNHLAGHIWDEFSSLSYKQRTSPGSLPKVVNPMLPLVGGRNPFGMRNTVDGGRGYMRNVSLLSVWSSEPLLHNNALGPYARLPDGAPDYSVKGLVKSFEQAMRELLTSDDPQAKKHRQLVVSRVPEDIAVPTREDGNSFLELTLPAGSPVGYMGSVDPHAPVFTRCDDYADNRGHQFGIDLSDPDKTALIEFLKTL